MLLAACGGSDEAGKNSGTTAEPDATQLAEQKCMGCHGKNLEGGSAPALDKIGADKTEEEIATIIKEGTKGGMPAGLVKDDEAEQLAKWLAEKK